MSRWFNTAGPCDESVHYMLPAASRLGAVRRLVERRAYFVVHAPRQVGKTTALMALAQSLTAEGAVTALLVSAEVGAAFPDDVGAAELAMLSSWRLDAETRLPAALRPAAWPEAAPGNRIRATLTAWAEHSARPLALFIDEIDALSGPALISVLRQLRSGYPNRPGSFPASIALIGLRDVRDYLVAPVPGAPSATLGSSSPFNVKVESLTMANFTADEVATLLGQHTAETGQRFTPAAVARVFELSQGQPWLVNALAAQLIDVVRPNVSESIDLADVDAAKEILIVRQDTHLDSLAERLREPRVRRVLEPILSGGVLSEMATDDLRYVQDLGLVRQGTAGGLEIANPIYREIVPRALSATARASLPETRATWLRADGSFDPDRLLEAFLAFWRQHGEPLLGTALYTEIAPHLVFMAFLHRVVNGGGTVEREYAVGRGRMDLCVRFRGVVMGIELKVWRDRAADPAAEGLAQLDTYLAGLGLETGWLVVFDRRSNAPPVAERTVAEVVDTPAGKQVRLVRA